MELSKLGVQIFPDPSTADLRVLELEKVPFQVKRIYWINNFVPGTERGFHAHKNLEQVLILQSGKIQLSLFWGTQKFDIDMKVGEAYYLPSGFWRVLSNASDNALLLVLASQKYEPDDYIRSWPEYLDWFENFHD